jgi:hypothetical protein
MFKIIRNNTIFGGEKRQNKYNFVREKRVVNKNSIVDEKIINH